MMALFEQDEIKANSNLQKHKVNFEEVKTVFDDPLARIFDDEFHSYKEERYIIVGKSTKNRLLFVIFTEKINELKQEVIRIISARNCTKKEIRDYEKFRK